MQGDLVNDCKLLLQVKSGKVLIQAEQCGMVELATMCGALEQLMGMEAINRGMDLEDVRTNMLDIHLAAMEALASQIIKERGDGTQ